MNRETETIFSSTGNLGVSRRQDHRLYVNATRVSDDPLEVEQNFTRLMAVSNRHPEKISRSVFRGVASHGVVQHILNNGLQKSVEVAFPLVDFTDDSSWLIYLAGNRPGRDQIVSTDVMVADTEIHHKKTTSPIERVKQVVERGYNFTDYIPENQVDQVHALWGETFGWERQEVDNLRRRLDAARDRQRDVWFSAVRDNGTIISVAMAERLTIPAFHGSLSLVESTEWRTRQGYAGQGLMTATLIMLNAQILAAFQKDLHQLPVLYAECNFQSRSDRAGFGAGFRIPPRFQQGCFIAQILRQNVLVRDGVQAEEGKLRDFTFMYLPKNVIQSDYGFIQTDFMAGILRK